MSRARFTGIASFRRGLMDGSGCRSEALKEDCMSKGKVTRRQKDISRLLREKKQIQRDKIKKTPSK
jgi:hypothetical protein